MSDTTTTVPLNAPSIDAECIMQITELKECGCIIDAPGQDAKADIFLELHANITGEGSQENLTHLTTVMRVNRKFSGAVLPKHSMIEFWISTPKRAQSDNVVANTTGYAYLCLRNVTDGMYAYPAHEPACDDHRTDLAPAMDPREILLFIVSAEPGQRPERWRW